MINLYHNGNFINVILLDESGDVPGSVWHNADDSYTIFINPRLSYEQQQKVFEHELKHIKGADFDKCSADKIEFDAHSA